ncbi:MAG: VOC family protein [Candidatus Nanopelagicales bacterium]
MAETLALDHVIIGVADLDDAAALLLVRHGLISLPGGEHPAWGTRNRIVPLGGCYLELVAVADPAAAEASGFGRWVAAMAVGDAPWGWVVRSSDLDETAARLGLEIGSGQRVRPDGLTLRWRLAGVPDVDPAERLRPFFIQWDEGTPMPGAVAVPHPAGQVAVQSVTASGSGNGVEQWLGSPVPLVDLVPGVGGVDKVSLLSDDGDVVIAPPLA